MKKGTVKEKLWKILIFDILFIIMFLTVFFLIRKSLIVYIGYLQIIQQNLANIDSSNIQEASFLVQSLEKSANRAYLYTFILAPLLFFIMYVILEGFSWKLIKKRGKMYFIKFGLISVPSYVFLLLFLISGLKNYVYLAFTLIFGFFTFIFYINPKFEIIINAFKRIYLFLPLYIFYIILNVLFLVSGFLAYLSFFIGNYFTLVPFFIVVLLLYSSYKLFLVEKYG